MHVLYSACVCIYDVRVFVLWACVYAVCALASVCMLRVCVYMCVHVLCVLACVCVHACMSSHAMAYV